MGKIGFVRMFTLSAVALMGFASAEASAVVPLKACQMTEGTWLECPVESKSGIHSGYALKKSPKARRSESALVLIAGGPGQAATEAFFPLSQLILDLNRNTDLMFFDPRGTAAPSRLNCPSSKSDDLTLLMNRELQLAKAQKCVKDLAKLYDLNQFGTDASAADLEQFRIDLGYEKLDLYGISYGTRLALRYAHLYPDRVGKIVLEGVLPPEALIGGDTYYLEEVLKNISGRCKKQEACAKAFPDPWADYEKLMKEYASTRTVEIEHPVSGRTQKAEMSRANLEGMLLTLLYTEFDHAMIPSLLHKAVEGNFAPLVAAGFGTTRTSVFEGLYYAIACSEDVPFYQEKHLTLRGQQLKEICRNFAFRPVAQSFHAPMQGSWPTLLLSGALDPVTAPSLIESFKKNLSAASHIVVPGKGHNVSYLPCVSKRIRSFLSADTSNEEDLKACTDVALPFLQTELRP